MFNRPFTLEEINDGLIGGYLREGQFLEFKYYLGPINYETVVKNMVGFANSGGGSIIIGASDNSFGKGIKIIGFPLNEKETFERQISTYINLRVKNLDDVAFNYLNVWGKNVAVVMVKPSKHGMSYVYSSSDAMMRTVFYRRGDKLEAERFQYHSVFKYMTIDAFIASLENDSWLFWEPSKWNDKYEQRFYCAKYHKIIRRDFSPCRVYATCVTKEQNSEAAWKVYAGREGLKTHCVQIELNVANLLKQFQLTGYSFFERRVIYKNENYIKNLHVSGAKDHSSYFSDFNCRSFLDLLSLKREAYEYEKEIRFFAFEQEPPEDRNLGAKAKSAAIKMQWRDAIKSIRIDNSCSDSELIAFRYSCWNAGIDPIFKGKKRELPEKSHPNSSSLVGIETTLFDIDEMPGGARITIQV